MGEIKIQRGIAIVPVGGTTSSPSTTFASLASTFVLNSNNRYQHGGYDDQTAANLEGDDMSGGIHLSATNTIDFDRQTGSLAVDMRFAWESWEYSGSTGGVNEFIVRGRYKLTLTAESITQSVSSISDIDNCIPFITGIFTDATTDSAPGAIAWMSSTGTLNVKRSYGSNGTIVVYVTVVEFTGSNWSVFHGRQEGSGTDSGTITLRDASDGTTAGGGDVSNWVNAIIFHQYKQNNLNAIDDSISDTSAIYYPGSNTTSVDWLFNSDHVDSATAGNREEHFVHVLYHSKMKIYRYSDTQNLGSAMIVSCSDANLSSLGTSSVVSSRISSGTGTAYGRGWVNTRLASITDLELWVHRSNNTIQTRIQVINLFSVDIIGIDDVDSDNKILNTQTDVVISGFGFGSSQGTGKVEIVENSGYTGTKINQSIDSWSDTSIQFDVSSGVLADSICYVFVTSDSGETSYIKITLGAPPWTYDEIIANINADHWWELDGDYIDNQGTSITQRNMVDEIGTPSFQSIIICEKNSQSLRFSGTTDRTNCADNNEMNSTAITERSMGGWIMLNDIQQQLAAVYKEGGQINNFAFITGFGNILMAQQADTDDDNVQAYSNFNLSVNRPYHIMFTMTYLDSLKEFRLWIDGIKQSISDGNPLTSTNMDSHTGNINWGDPDNNLEMGGTDISFKGKSGCYYAQWLTTRTLISETTIREELFEKGALPYVKITGGTESEMQSVLDNYKNTEMQDYPCSLRIYQASGKTDFTLIADNITFDELSSINLQFFGTGILTWVNINGSSIDTNKISTPNGGTVIINNIPTLKISGLQDNTEIRIYESGTTIEISGVESTGGTFKTNIFIDYIDIQVISIDYTIQRFENVDMTNGDLEIPIEQPIDRIYFNP